jgi:phospholipid/cholesterol/gamma-HCH transport system permease protein
MMASLANSLTFVGASSLRVGKTVKSIISLCVRLILTVLKGECDREEAWKNLYQVGVKSFPIVVLTALFTGAIMVIQTAYYVRKTGATGLIGYGVGLTVFAEIGPILVGLMFSGRVGANNTAELGTMVVTEQVDALRALAIDPVGFLAAPRFIAMMVMLTLLMVMGDLFAIVGAAITSELVLGFNWRVLVANMLESHLLDEFLLGIIKAGCFGVAISCISCHFGFQVRGGAAGVGRAVNATVVASATAIFVIDFIVGSIYVS